MQSVVRQRRRNDAGAAFLITVLVAIGIMVIVGAIFGPRVMDYLSRGHDSSVQSDLQNYATAAQANLIGNGGAAYVAEASGFNTDGTEPQYSSNNIYKAWVQEQGADAGFVIVGINVNSEQAFGISSYNGAAVVELTTLDTMDKFDALSQAPSELLGDGMTGIAGSAIIWGETG